MTSTGAIKRALLTGYLAGCAERLDVGNTIEHLTEDGFEVSQPLPLRGPGQGVRLTVHVTIDLDTTSG